MVLFIYNFSLYRYSLSHPPDTVKPPSKLKRYLVDNCVRFAEWYEQFLERRYPKLFHVYKIFKIGKNCFFLNFFLFALILRAAVVGLVYLMVYQLFMGYLMLKFDSFLNIQ